MNLLELVEHVKSNYLRDSQDQELWSAQELIKYFNAAQNLFARHTHCLIDTDVVVTTAPSIARYTLDPKIIYVYEVYDSDGRRVHRHNRHKLPRSLYEGKPLGFTQDTGTASIRFSPTPDDEYTFSLLVARLPSKPLARQYDVPEIPEEYHIDLCDYVAYMAVRNNDTESSEIQAGNNFRTDWETKLRDAKRNTYHYRIGSNSQAVNNWTGSGR